VVVGRPLTEHELVERARAGDGSAYATLVRDHEETAFRIAYVICGNAADAEEAAQEAFVKAYNALGRFRSGEPRAMLLAALGRMSERDRSVIACRYLLELSEAETASTLGVRPGTVKSRLSRALERLREEVGEDA